MKTKRRMVKSSYVLVKKLCDAFFLILLRAVKVCFILVCFSVSLKMPSGFQSGAELFSVAFAEEESVNKEQIAKAVWEIQKGKGIGLGSGFFISENQIVTNFHVISSAESIGLENISLVQDGNPKWLKVKRIVSLSILDDLAVLEIEGSVSHFLNLPSEDVLNSSKSLYLLGYPNGKFKEIRQTGLFTEESFFGNHSLPIGASGGPVLNESHQLIGVLHQAVANLLYFVSVKTLRSFIEDKYFLCNKSFNVKECFRFSREIFEKFTQAAKGMREYHNKIGRIYYEGERVERGFALVREFGKVSGSRLARVQYKLAIVYSRGNGVSRDLLLGKEWMEKSAVQGYALAQHELVMMYYREKGLSWDFPLAREWIEKAAVQGYAPAQYTLAMMYYREKGLGWDFPLAREWIEKAAVQGYAPAQYMLAIINRRPK